MSTDNKISRRDALKRMGAAVLGGAVASSGLLSLTSCEGNRRQEQNVLRCGNLLHPQRPRSDADLAEKSGRPRCERHYHAGSLALHIVPDRHRERGAFRLRHLRTGISARETLRQHVSQKPDLHFSAVSRRDGKASCRGGRKILSGCENGFRGFTKQCCNLISYGVVFL